MVLILDWWKSYLDSLGVVVSAGTAGRLEGPSPTLVADFSQASSESIFTATTDTKQLSILSIMTPGRFPHEGRLALKHAKVQKFCYGDSWTWSQTKSVLISYSLHLCTLDVNKVLSWCCVQFLSTVIKQMWSRFDGPGWRFVCSWQRMCCCGCTSVALLFCLRLPSPYGGA